jgi:hypothetical protein
MTPKREAKRVEHAIRAIPVEAIAPTIAAYKASERWLLWLVGDKLPFVYVDGKGGTTRSDYSLDYAQMIRWVRAHPERAHQTYQTALAFVREKLSN